jgi:hypothetical protein
MDKTNYNNLDEITNLLFNVVYKRKNICNNVEKKEIQPEFKVESKNNKNLVNMQNILKERRNIIPFFKQ